MFPALILYSVCFFLQRAKINQGTKAPEEKTANTISKFDNNGNRDRMKLTDFNFLMVLGKGSFGKVQSDLVVTSTLDGTDVPMVGKEVNINKPRLQTVLNIVKKVNRGLSHLQTERGPTHMIWGGETSQPCIQNKEGGVENIAQLSECLPSRYEVPIWSLALHNPDIEARTHNFKI